MTLQRQAAVEAPGLLKLRLWVRLLRTVRVVEVELRRRLRAEFVANDRNRMMLVTLRFAGFREIGRAGRATLLESDVSSAPAIPDWLVLVDRDGASAGTALAAACGCGASRARLPRGGSR